MAIQGRRVRRIRRDVSSVVDDLAGTAAPTVRWYEAIRFNQQLELDDWRTAR